MLVLVLFWGDKDDSNLAVVLALWSACCAGNVFCSLCRFPRISAAELSLMSQMVTLGRWLQVVRITLHRSSSIDIPYFCEGTPRLRGDGTSWRCGQWWGPILSNGILCQLSKVPTNLHVTHSREHIWVLILLERSSEHYLRILQMKEPSENPSGERKPNSICGKENS